MTPCVTYHIGPKFRARFYENKAVEWTWDGWKTWSGIILCPCLFNEARSAVRNHDFTKFLEVVG